MFSPEWLMRRSTATVFAATLCLAGCAEELGPTTLVAPVTATPCHQMACDDVAGTCVEVPVVDGAACDDGDACTSGDRCVAGACVTTPVVCDDANACTTDRCDTALGCVFAATTDPCDDGDACTDDRCDPAVGCVAPPRAGLAGYCDRLGQRCPAGFVCNAGQWCESCDGGELFVPAGRFWMGCNDASDPACSADELPQHRVVVDAFAIQRTEVTADAYRACVEGGGCSVPTTAAGPYGTYGVPEKSDHPVTPVTWYQARDFCAWLDAPSDRPWRLCAEAEWEKAARGSCAVYCDRADDDACCRAAMPVWPWGDEAATCELAIMDDGGNGCGTGVTWPVASRPDVPSAYGVLDLAGNVWEWVQDCWHPDYEDAPADGSAWEGASCGPGGRVIRGGSFGLSASELRASERFFISPDVAYDYYGFRCCRSVH